MTRFDADAWSRWAAAWPERRSERGEVVDRLVLSFADRHLPPGRLLDAGCGDGFYARALSSTGRELVLVDREPALVRAARDASPDLRVVEADLTGLPFPDATFDGVFCLTVLEWLPDPVAGLRELVRVTRPGGALVVGVLGAGNRTRDLHLERFYGASPMNGLLPWELSLLAEREGLRTVEQIGASRDGPVEGARDAMTRAMLWLVALRR